MASNWLDNSPRRWAAAGGDEGRRGVSLGGRQPHTNPHKGETGGKRREGEHESAGRGVRSADHCLVGGAVDLPADRKAEKVTGSSPETPTIESRGQGTIQAYRRRFWATRLIPLVSVWCPSELLDKARLQTFI